MGAEIDAIAARGGLIGKTLQHLARGGVGDVGQACAVKIDQRAVARFTRRGGAQKRDVLRALAGVIIDGIDRAGMGLQARGSDQPGKGSLHAVPRAPWAGSARRARRLAKAPCRQPPRSQ